MALSVKTGLHDYIQKALVEKKRIAELNKDPRTYQFRSPTKYGAKSAFKAASGYTKSFRQQYENRQFDYLRDQMENLDMVDKAAGLASNAFDHSFARSARQASRYAMNPSKAQKAYDVQKTQLQAGLTLQQAVNSARLQQDSVRNAIQGGLLDYGAGQLQSGSQMVTESYNNYEQQRNAYRAAKAQQKTAMMQTGVMAAAMVAAAFM